jgi:Primase C terminal 2 (PriCT-2)/Bifunctional DNA primase/polymerase, N-terminal
MSADFHALLYEYAERLKWALIPARAGEKRPSVQDWPNRVFNCFELDPNGNVGVKLGHRSGGLVDIDLDCSEALALAEIYLPPSGAIFGRSSKPQSHYFYTASSSVFETFVDPIGGDTLLELRADGRTGGCHQTIVPPSIAGGERREWQSDTIEPVVVDHRVLRRRCARLAIGCLVARYVGETAARKPLDAGWDHPKLLWECDHALGRRAYEWLRKPAPDAPQCHPRPRAERSQLEVDLDELAAAIPNAFDWEAWNRIGLAFFAASGGSEAGFAAFDDLSARSPKYCPRETAARWANYRRSPPSHIGKGTLIHLARQAGWRPGGSHGRAA